MSHLTPALREYLEERADERTAVFEEALREYIEESHSLDENDLLTIIRAGYMLGLAEGLDKDRSDMLY